MATRSASFLFLAFGFLLTAGTNAFSSIGFGRNQRVATTTANPTALAAAIQRSPSTNAVSFLRINQSYQKKHHHGLTDASAEGDLPAHEGIKNKGEDPDTKHADKPSGKKKKGYQRVEDWDADQKAGGMTWEQKVQFDGLRMGNGVRQNEILQRHLSSF